MVAPGTLVPDAAAVLSEQVIGAVIIGDSNAKILGILSERDVTRCVAQHRAKIMEMRVENFMVGNVITCKSSLSTVKAMEIMQVKHIRHLPVLDEDDRAIGIVSMRELMAVCIEDMLYIGLTR